MDENQVEGRNSVLELIESGKDINKIFVQAGEKHGSIMKIIAKAKAKGIVIVEVQKRKLDEMATSNNHQGVIAQVPPFEYAEIEDILMEAEEKKEVPFILILDGIEDPHNLGSIIRTAETAGVHGVIIPKRRAAAVNATVSKTSAGAVEYMKIARVNNINEAIKTLKNNRSLDMWYRYGHRYNLLWPRLYNANCNSYWEWGKTEWADLQKKIAIFVSKFQCKER